MTARDMFEKLGYQRNAEKEKIIYLIETKGSFYYQEIIFNLLQKVIVIDGNFLEVAIETNLLKAIDKQAKELGWLEEEKQEIKQETNFEHYKDEILECCIDDLAVVKGIPKPCSKTDCNDCDFLTIQKDCHEIAKDWIKQPCKKPTYKLSQFEYDLLNAYKNSGMRQCISNYGTLLEMYGKGYFKGIDTITPIHEILDNCEVMD